MLDIQQYIGIPKIIMDNIDDKTMKFSLEFLPRWFGHTLGNAVRRIMLWYDFWGAITWVKVSWAPHEYHVIDWVKESVIDILLSLKELRFKLDENMDSEMWITQKFSWVGIFTAKELKMPTGVAVLNPDQYICEISDPSVELTFDIRVEKWYGYYSIDFLESREDKKEGRDAQMLLLDNDFKIVDYVTYDVEQVIDDLKWWVKDRLMIEVKMSHSGISPKEFLAFTGEVLASYAKLFIFDDVYVDRSMLIEYDDLRTDKQAIEEEMHIKTMPIDALPLSERTRNALIKNNILYVEDLEKKKKGELLLMKWVWRKAIEEITSALGNINKSLLGS